MPITVKMGAARAEDRRLVGHHQAGNDREKRPSVQIRVITDEGTALIVDSDKAEATFRNGVLTVRLPQRPEAKAKVRKVEVKSA